MRKLLVALILVGLLSAPLQAADWWNTTVAHKSAHVVGGATIAFTVGTLTKKPAVGFWTGCGAGVAKEMYDQAVSGIPGESVKSSFIDIGITCAGSYVGYRVAKWWVNRHQKQRYTAMKLNVTNLPITAGLLLPDVHIGTSSKFHVYTNGTITE